MNIAYVIGSLNAHGGVERIIADKANELSKEQDINVYILSLSGDPAKPLVYQLDERVRLVYAGCIFDPGNTGFKKNPIMFGIKWLRWHYRQRKAIYRFVKENRIELIIYPTHLAHNLPVRPGCHLILESHTNRSHTNFHRPWNFKRRLRAAKELVTLTTNDSKQWTDAKSVNVIPNFTKIKPVAHYNPDTRKIMAAGRLSPEKGFDVLIEAWKLVAPQHPDWSLDIYCVPFSINIADMQSRIDRAALRTCVKLCNPTTDMAKSLSEHSLYVMSSRYEGLPLVLIEAMACGVPCVSFDCPEGPSEIITDGEDGWLVPFRGLSDEERADALADALCDAIANREKRIKFSESGLSSVKRFSPEVIIPKWIELFKSLTDSKK